MNEEYQDNKYNKLTGYEIENHTLICPQCNKTWHIRANIKRGYTDHEDVICPYCNTTIKNIRADMGYDIEEVINSEK